MPKVREAVKQFFKKEPSLSVNPDEAVAIGAALQASIIANSGLIVGSEERELILVDVTPLNLGIKVQSGEMAIIVPAQTTVPCRLSHVFTTVQDFQTEIHTEVYQGNRPMADQNRLIGKYTMMGIPAAPAGVPKIEVIFDISANGTITVTSIDQASKSQQSVAISMSGGLSDAEIERMRKDAELNAAADQAVRDRSKNREQYKREVLGIQRGVDSYPSLSESTRNELKSEIASLQKLLDDPHGADAQVTNAFKALKEKAGKVLGAAYQAGQAQSQPQQDQSQPQSQPQQPNN